MVAIQQAVYTINGLILEHLVIARKYLMWAMKHNPPDYWKEGKKGDILFLQGFNEGWTFFSTIGEELHELGYRLHHIKELDMNFFPIEEGVRRVKEYIAKNHLENFVIISHSKGGIIGKALLNEEEFGKKISALIAIAPPFKGTIFGHVRVLSLNELVPDSVKVKAIVENKTYLEKIYVLHSTFDNLVLPNSSLKVDGIETVELDTVGHTELLDNSKTIEKIKEILLKVY